MIQGSRLVEGDPCLTALCSIWYRVYAMARGGDFSSDIAKYEGWTNNVTTVACPDDQNRVFFEIERVENKPKKPRLRILPT